MVARLELSGLGRSLVGPLLVALGSVHMFSDDQCNSVNPLLRLLDVFYQGVERRGLLLPSLPGQVQESLRPPAKEELEWGEASKCLGGLSVGKEHLGQEEVPLSAIFIYHPSQHPLDHLIESLHQAVCLRVVNGSL